MTLNRRTFTALTAGAAAALALPAQAATVAPEPGRRHVPHTVTFDKYSLLLDDRRLVLWSGEFHPFRLPSPSLWTDVLQKMRSNGYNAVSIYVNWSYHSCAPGQYDFTGVRNLGRFLAVAAQVGIFVTVRPGPYINAEVDAGGFPGWLTATTGTARTNNSTYLSYADEWLTAVNAIVSKHQYTDGGGTVLLYQLENEYSSHLGDGVGAAYLAHLYAKVRADGITVPLFHNDKGRNGDWIPGSFSTNGESGRYLYAFDGYPSPSSTPPDWGYFGPGGAKGGSTASPDTPGFEAEFGGGWFDPWGGAEFAGQGYAGARASRDAVYERRFYLTNLANGIKLQNVYMTFGGTSWGWLPAPVVYTSYDYGAAVDEARNQTSKLVPMKQIGLMLESVPDLAELDRAADVTASSTAIKTYHLTNPTTGAHFYFLRNDTASDQSITVPVSVSGSQVTVPASGAGIRLTGKDMKVVATGIAVGRRTLRYTTAQPMYAAAIGARDVALLIGRTGDPVELSLAFAAAPTVSVLSGSATSSYDSTAGALRVNAQLSGLIRVLIAPSDGSAPLLLLLADDEESATFWKHDSFAGPVLVRGPALLRNAFVMGPVAALNGDTTAASDLEVWAPTGIRRLLWNGSAIPTGHTVSGSLSASIQLPAPAQVTLPALTNWRYAPENPESAPGFDDSAWALANKTTSFSTTPVPAGQPVLFADDYGFHYGDVWYRGSYNAQAGAQSVSLSYSSGTQGMLMAWLDGVPLGMHRQPVPTKAQDSQSTWTATATFAVPAALSGSGPHVLAVLVRPMAHSEDGGSNDAHKAARGLTAVTFTGETPAPSVTWRIQGADTAASDPLRGPLNNGGLYGERSGWHLPTFGDGAWQRMSLPSADTSQGVGWLRTTFNLAIPRGADASIGLTLTDDPARAYRVQIFLNGWNLGQYINDVGPQHTFVLPNGILRSRGRNTLALAVLRDGTTPAGPSSVSLTLLGLTAGGVPVEDLPLTATGGRRH